MVQIAKRIILTVCLFVVAGCVSPEGATRAEKQAAVRDMRSDTLSKLYRIEPYAKTRIGESVGYAVFSNVGINVFLLSTGSGYGIVKDRGSGRETFMKMYSAGLGPGLGIKDFRAVFVFTKRDALDQFVEAGWDASAQADAAAKSGEKGDAWAGAVDVAPGIRLYQMTENGLALQATIQGTKYWPDDDLNR